MSVPEKVPFIVLTGFLGSGKTTLLNRILAAQHHRRIAVIVNELGRIDIDGGLLKQRSGDVVELVGGCVCHEITTQEELWEGLREVVQRSKPDVIILETTGIAEPGPILESFSLQPQDECLVQPWAVVTVVEAEAGKRQLESYQEAKQQVLDADRILLTKLDLAGPESLQSVHDAITAINPDAERASFPDGSNATMELTQWLLAPGAPARRANSRKTHGHPHHHDRQIVAASFQDDAPLVQGELLRLCENWGPTLLRVKGFVNLAGEDRRAYVEKAGDRVTLRFEGSWPAGPRRSQLVFIGEGLDPAAVNRQLWACRAMAQQTSLEIS